jgi:hypothetical protein
VKNGKNQLRNHNLHGNLAHALSTTCCILLLLACAAQPGIHQPTRTQVTPPPATGREDTLTAGEGSAAAAEMPVRPRVMIVVKEIPKDDILTVNDRMLETEPTEAMVMEAFQSRGFPVVDPAAVSQNLQQDQLRRILEGDNRAVVEVGLRAEADVVVAGTVLESHERRAATNAADTADFVKVRLSARAVNTATGVVLASTLLELEEPSSKNVVRHRAADSVGIVLSAGILESWRGRINITEIYADNADDQRVRLLESAIMNEARGMDSVVTRSLEGRSAVVEVFSDISTDELLAQINHCITAIPFVVTGFSGNRIDLRFGDEPGQCPPDRE